MFINIKKKRNRILKIILVAISIMVALFILIIVFISPIAKYIVEKYDEKYTGRQITMDWAYVNPFTGYVHFDNFKFYEYKSDSSFLSCDGVSAQLNISKLFSKEYEIENLTLSKPIITVIQLKKIVFNFTDLIEKFSKNPDKAKKDTTPVHFNLLKIKVEDGIFVFHEKMTPINYAIKNVNIESTGIHWNADTINTKFSFDAGIGSGHIQGHFNINTALLEYRTAIVIKKFDLNIIEQYMKALTNYGTFRAYVDADVKARGSLKESRNLDAHGNVMISDFHFGKSRAEDFASFDKFVLAINQLNPLKKKYMIDSVSLFHPFVKYEKYDHLDNIQNIFGKGGANVKGTAKDPEKFNLIIEIARYVKLLSKNFFESDYKINRLSIYKADLHYNNYSINEKFSVAANPLTIVADSVNSNNKRVKVELKSGIKPFGDLKIVLSINPKDSSDFELSYNLEKMNATLFNPYLISLTSFPLDRGSIEFIGKWNVKNGAINSNNHLLVIDPRITKRIKSNKNKWLPLKLFMFFVRERGNAIDYEIPITGNLKDPKFHLKDVVFDIITNILIKPATSPYSLEVKTVENMIEKTLAFNWQLHVATLMPENEKFLRTIADFLKDNPNASIEVFPFQYSDKEKEYISFFEAKKKYYLKKYDMEASSFSTKDSINVEKMSVKDSMFVQYLHTKINDKMMFTMQERCVAFVGENTIKSKFDKLVKNREEVFKNYFKDGSLIDRVKIQPSSSKVPFDGFSYYKISYDGKIPPETKEAFEKLKEFDSEKPREKLKDKRNKMRRFFNLK